MKSLIHIGADVEKLGRSLPEITKSILQILNVSAGDDVKIKALDSLSAIYQVNNTTVTNCTLTGK